MALAGACKPADRDTRAVDNDRSGTDTVVQSETVKDTTVINADTNLDVDDEDDHAGREGQQLTARPRRAATPSASSF